MDAGKRPKRENMSTFPTFKEVDSLDYRGYIAEYNVSPNEFLRLVLHIDRASPSKSKIPRDGFMMADIVVFTSSENGHSAEMLVPKAHPACRDIKEQELQSEWKPSAFPSPVERMQVKRINSIADMPVRLIDTGCGWQTMSWVPRSRAMTFRQFVKDSMDKLQRA